MYNTPNYNQSGAPLPVAADRLMTGLYAPDQIPAMRLNGLPSQNAQYLTSLLAHTVQAEAERNPVRIFMFNYMSQNGFQNEPFFQLFERFVAYINAVNVDPNVAAPDIVNTCMAELFFNYPALQQYVHPEQFQQLQQLRQDLDTILRSIAAAQRPPAYQQPNQGGYQQPAYGHGHQQPTRPGMVGSAVMSSAQPNQGATSLLRSTQPQSQGGYQTKRPGMVGSAVESTLDTTKEKPFQPTTQNFNREDNDMKLHSQEEREFGHLSGAEAVSRNNTFILEDDMDIETALVLQRYAPAVSSSHVVRLSVGDDDVKEFTVKEKGMDYKDHESDIDMIKLSDTAHVGPKVMSTNKWDDVSLPSEVDPSEDTNVGFIESHEPVVVKGINLSNSLYHSVSTARSALIKLGIDDIDERVIESYSDVVTPMHMSNDEHEYITANILTTKSIFSFIDAMISAVDELSPRVWHFIHNKATEIFNVRLRAGSAIQCADHIDSLIEDYEVLMPMIRNELKSDAVDRFQKNTHTTIMKNLVLSDVDDVSSFVTRCSITSVPWSSSDIDLLLPEKYSMLTTLHQDIAAAALKIVWRTNTDVNSMAHRYIVTADNVWLELHVSDFHAESVSVSKYVPQ